MRNLLNGWDALAVWGLFFATTVYGHVALKLAVGNLALDNFAKIFRAFAGFWGWSALLAWVASALLWAIVLSKNTLLTANAVSSLRYVFIGFAAYFFLRESLSFQQMLGAVLIGAGIWLMNH